MALGALQEALMSTVVPPPSAYFQPRHLTALQSGKVGGPNLSLPRADICMDITWYRLLAVGDQETLRHCDEKPPCVQHNWQALPSYLASS